MIQAPVGKISNLKNIKIKNLEYKKNPMYYKVPYVVQNGRKHRFRGYESHGDSP